MDNKTLKLSLFLALAAFFTASFVYGAQVSLEIKNTGADISALTKLADEYAATNKPSELQLALEKLAVLREEWEALGRPSATPEQLAPRIILWRAAIASRLKSNQSPGDTVNSDVASLPYPNEFNGSTLNKNEVVITFDDGPHPKLTPIVHGIIKDLKIPAAFFELGENIKNNPKLTQGLAAEGYIIGDHSWDHPNLITLDNQKVEQQINDTQKEIQSVLGGADGFNLYFQTFFATFFKMPETIFAPEFFRSPYGSRSARTMNIILNTAVGETNVIANGKTDVEVNKFFHIMWNVDSLDWQDHDPASIEKRVFDQLATFGHHGIILFHDIHPQTIEAIQLILPRLAKEGYKFVSLYDLVREVDERQSTFFR